MKHTFRYVLVFVLCSFAFAYQKAFADGVSNYKYILYTLDTSASPGCTLTIALNMKNDNAISAYQTDVYLPTGFALKECSMGTRSSLTRHSLDMVQKGDGGYRILSSSTSNLSYTGNDGVVAYLTITVPNDASAGSHTLSIRNQEMTEANNTGHKITTFSSNIIIGTSGGGATGDNSTIELTDLSKYNYAVYVDNSTGISNSGLQLPISMKNAGVITAFQADIYLPEGFSFDTEGNITFGSRTSSRRHNCMIKKMDDGGYRVICSSQNNLPFADIDGIVLKIPITPDASAKSDTYYINIRNQELTSSNNSNYKCNSVTSKFSYTSNNIIEQNLLNSTTLSSGDYVLYANDMKTDAGVQLILPLSLKNASAITGFQVDLYVPDGLTLSMADDGFGTMMPVASLAGRTTDANHSLSIVKQADGAYRILCASNNVKTFSGNDGVVANITFEVSSSMQDGNYEIKLLNQTIGSPDNTGHSDYSFQAKLTVGEVGVELGDVNGDDTISMSDLTYLIAYFNGSAPSDFVLEAADINADGVVNISDIKALSDIILNK